MNTISAGGRGVPLQPKIAAVILLSVMLLSTSYQISAQSPSSTSSPSSGSDALGMSSFAQGILKINQSELLTLVGGEANMNVAGFLKLISDSFWPSQTRVVGLDIGWTLQANTTSPIPKLQWVDDFLKAADEDKISVAFRLPDWGESVAGQSWWKEVEAAYPFMQTSNLNGTPSNQDSAASLVLNSPIVAGQLKRDLTQLLSYYGNHTSWVGLLSESLSGSPSTDQLLANTGFDGYTISSFANSTFYLRTVGATGIYSDGTPSSLWTAFHEPTTSPDLVSGSWQSPDYLSTYNGSRNTLGIRVSVPHEVSNPMVKIYMSTVGSPPAPLNLTLVPTSNSTGYPDQSKPLGSALIAAASVSETAGWTTAVQFNGATLFTNSSYWILVNTQGGDQSNAYRVWYRDFNVDNSAIATEGYRGAWYPTGSAIAWITDSTGSDVKIYPYQTMGIARNDATTVTQRFDTSEALDVRTVYIHVADKLYTTVNSTLQIVDNSNSLVVASVTFSQALFRGTYWWVPISLPEPVHLQPEHSYSLVLLPVPRGNGWQWHYLTTDPPKAGFDNMSQVQLFRLESYSIESANLMHIGPPGRTGPENGFPGATNSTWYAQSYNITSTSPLTLIQANVEKYCTTGAVTGALQPCAAGQHPGNLVVQVRENNATGFLPGPTVLAQQIVPESQIPWGRVWVNATGWNVTLSAGKTYWVVLKTVNGTAGGYYPWKEESAYEHMILRSSDAGATWGRPREPADMFINLKTLAQAFSVEPQSEITTNVGTTSWVGQSIEVQQLTNVSTVLIFVSRSVGDNYGVITADIRADDGEGHPSGMILATGTLTQDEALVSWKGIWAVALDYPITLQPGVRYWLVFRSVDTYFGSKHYPEMGVQAFSFHNDSASYGGSALGALASSDSGSTWNLIGGVHTDLIFGLAYNPSAPQKPPLSQLVEEIESRQVVSSVEGNMSIGWRAYLASSTSRILSELVQWLNGANLTTMASVSEKSNVTARTWFAFDQNSPSAFLQSNPTLASEFSLSPTVNLSSSAQISVPGTRLANSVPVVILPLGSADASSVAARFVSVLPLLGRSFLFLDTDPVSFFGSLPSLSGTYATLSRMRTEGLSWPRFNSSAASNASAGPWLTSFGDAPGYSPEGAPTIPGSRLLQLDVATMSLSPFSGLAAKSANGSALNLSATYLLPGTGELGVLYSNLPTLRGTVYPNQDLVTVNGSVGEAVWLLVNSTSPLQSVSVNQVRLDEALTYASLLSLPYSSGGWAQAPDGTVLIRYQSTGHDTVRIVQEPPVPGNALEEALRTAWPFLVISAVVIIDAVIWVRYVKRKREAPESEGTSRLRP